MLVPLDSPGKLNSKFKIQIFEFLFIVTKNSNSSLLLVKKMKVVGIKKMLVPLYLPGKVSSKFKIQIFEFLFIVT